MIHNYEEFCRLHDAGQVEADLSSPGGYASLQSLKKDGWKIPFFGRQKAFLKICRLSQENFETAYRHAGVDFWRK